MPDYVKPFRALYDETRLRILNAVMQKDCCVCEIMQALEISQTRASRNLGILAEAGFLKSRREGVWVLYTLCSDRENRYAAHLNAIVKEVAGESPIFNADIERLKKAKRIGHGCEVK